MSNQTSLVPRVMRQPLALAAAAGWLSFIGWRTISSWPRPSLDMAANDAATQDALGSAITQHLSNALILGAIGIAVVFGLAALLTNRSPSSVATVATKDWSGPRRVLLMRHAEKTGDPEDIHLSAAGQQRAEKLVRYIPATFGVPDYLFAAAQSRRSVRSIETLQPLATATGKPLRYDVEDDDFEDLVAELASQPQYRQALVVIAWHHKKIDNIAALLGAADGTYPDPWAENLYDVIVDLDYSKGTPPIAKIIKQPF